LKGSKVADKTVELSEPIQGQRGAIKELRFRAPLFSDYMDLGDPESLIGLNNGEAGFYQEDMKVIGQYIERLVLDFDINFLSRLSLRDALAVKHVILSFFRDATRPKTLMEPKEPSGSGSQEPSSSATDSPLQPSII
jgi:hypothetical protein